MSYLTFNALLALVAIAGVVCRLAALPPAKPNLRSQVAWYGWMWAHVLIGVGCFGVVLGPFVGAQPAHGGSTMMLAGLAMLFGVRWHRRHGGMR